jgi:hypothetical protein
MINSWLEIGCHCKQLKIEHVFWPRKVSMLKIRINNFSLGVEKFEIQLWFTEKINSVLLTCFRIQVWLSKSPEQLSAQKIFDETVNWHTAYVFNVIVLYTVQCSQVQRHWKPDLTHRHLTIYCRLRFGISLLYKSVFHLNSLTAQLSYEGRAAVEGGK